MPVKKVKTHSRPRVHHPRAASEATSYSPPTQYGHFKSHRQIKLVLLGAQEEMITAVACLLINVQGPGLHQAGNTVRVSSGWTRQSLSQAACLPRRDDSTRWGHRFPHCSTGGNWSTSPSSVLSCSPRAKLSLYRSRTFSCNRGLQVRISPGVPSVGHSLDSAGGMDLVYPCLPMLSPLTWDRKEFLLQVMPGLQTRGAEVALLCPNWGSRTRGVLWSLPCLPSVDWPAA